MRVAVLFSGGKDSTLAIQKAMENNEVACLVTIVSKNKESYMFHTPNIRLTRLQAKAIGLPLIQKTTEGKKEDELGDLKKALVEAKRRFGIDGVVTGAVESVYQSSRIQKVCNELGLCCMNPLWKKNQEELLREIVAKGFKVLISGAFAHPFDRSWVGRELDEKLIEELLRLRGEYGVSPSGEGGEIETTVLDAPMFKKKIVVLDFLVEAKGNSNTFIIRKARLVKK
ncbi:MAG: TIGR00289 family protein [Candidatus Bathyarchaeia archaeon]